MSKSKMSSTFVDLYPNVAEWVESWGWIEMGYDDFNQSFVRALDIGGMIWEGEHNYESVELAMRDLEAGIAAWLAKNR